MTSVLVERDALGTGTIYYRASDPRSFAARLRPLLPSSDLAIDGAGLAFAWGLPGGDATRSWCAGARRLAPGQRLLSDGTIARALDGDGARSIEEALVAEVARLVEGAALWLSGGLDSALLLALLRRLGHTPATYVLAPRLRDYDESLRAIAHARALGIDPIVVPATVDDFVDALPAAVAAAETPFWNLHPVSKFLLARRTAADGFAAAITGDGADEAFAAAPVDDYLPLVVAIARAGGVEVRSPFFAPAVVATARAGSGRGKRALVELARTLLPETVWATPKRAWLAPPVPLPCDDDALTRLAATVPSLAGAPPAGSVHWVTLLLLCRALGLAF